MSRRIGSVSATQPQSPAGAPVLVLVTGPPGSGKSAVAATLREQLQLPLIAKDSLKEALGDALAVQGRAESQPLGAAVFMLLARVAHELLANNVSLIAEGNFQAASALFVDLPPARIVQVHVTAEPALLRTRLLERAEHRHPVHWDAEAADEVAARAAAGDWPALPLGGELVEIDTTTWPDLHVVAARVGERVQNAAGPCSR
jgi:predicted kinase